MAPEETGVGSGGAREDSPMPTGGLGERLHRLLRCLEDPGRNPDPANIDSALICKASITHTQQIEALGVEYNHLEEAIHNLEQANNDRETRVRRLEEQAKNWNDDEARLGLLEQRVEGHLPAMGSTSEDSAATPLKAARSALREFLNARPAFRDRRSAHMLAEFSIHEVVEELLRRFREGEKLSRNDFPRLEHHLFPPALPPKRKGSRPPKKTQQERHSYKPSWMRYALEAGTRRRREAVSDDEAEPASDDKSKIMYDTSWLHDTMTTGRRKKAEESRKAGKQTIKDSSPNNKDEWLLQQLGLEPRRKVERPRKDNLTTPNVTRPSTIRGVSQIEADSDTEEEDDRTIARRLMEIIDNVDPPIKRMKRSKIRQIERLRSQQVKNPEIQQSERPSTSHVGRPKRQQTMGLETPQGDTPRMRPAEDAGHIDDKPENEADVESAKDNSRSGPDTESEEDEKWTFEQRFLEDVQRTPSKRVAAARAENSIAAQQSRDRTSRVASLSVSEEEDTQVGYKPGDRRKRFRPSKRVSFELSDTEVAAKLLALGNQHAFNSGDAQLYSFPSGPLVKKTSAAGSGEGSSENVQRYSFPTGPLVKKKGIASKIHGPVPSKRGLDASDSSEVRKRRKGRISASSKVAGDDEEEEEEEEDEEDDDDDDDWIPEPDMRQEFRFDKDTVIADGRAGDDDPRTVKGVSRRSAESHTPPQQISSPSFVGHAPQADSPTPPSKPFGTPSCTSSHNSARSVANDLLSHMSAQLPAEHRPEKPAAITPTLAESTLNDHVSASNRQDSVLERGDDMVGKRVSLSTPQHPKSVVPHLKTPASSAPCDSRSPSIRSSVRKRTQPAFFGSPIHWKEANALVKGLRPSAP